MWLHKGKPGESFRPFDCDRDCGVEPELNNGVRERRGCTRVDLPPVEWQVDPEEIAFYLGRHADRRLHLKTRGTWERPAEDTADGCPGGYQRAPMLGPLTRYYRRRDQNGGRIANPFFDRCDDWLIHSAILCLEQEEDRAHSEWTRVDTELMRRQVEHGQ